jgi:hypothetical protein
MAGAPSASTSSFTASPTTLVADGTSSTTLTLTVEDAYGNRVANTLVTLASSDSGDVFGATSGTTNAQGQFTTTLKSTTAGTDTITATEGSASESTPVTFIQLDHWTNGAGGNWKIASSWSAGLPTAILLAAIDKSGTYTVPITGVDMAYGLVLNDAGATVTDNNNGVLTLAGAGGLTNPNGALEINAGTFVLNGGALIAGTISIASGGSLAVSSKPYTGSQALAEAISDDGTIVISKDATFLNNITGSGSFSIQGNSTLELGAADSANVTFAAGSTGTIKFDRSLTAPPTGRLSGLTPQDRIDLADLAWVQNKMTATPNASGSQLTVSNGSESVVLYLSGNYSQSTWTLSKDSTGGTFVVDPPANGSLTPSANGGAQGAIDLSNISFGNGTTLGYSPNSSNTGGTLTVSDGTNVANVALLGQYMASSFAMARDGHGGTLITDPPPNQHPPLTAPHA